MNLTDKIFTDKNAARQYLEASRWSDGAYCPHCGGVDRIKKLEGSSHRPGLYQCGDCRQQFTVTVGTVFERSKVPLNKWLLATFLMASSKKGISAHQLHRTIGVTYKTAWFMFHRIREAMSNNDPVSFGSGGGVVEVDETFIGKDKTARTNVKRTNWLQRNKILTLVDRETKRARSVVIDDLKAATIQPIIAANVSKNASLMTDQAHHYKEIGREYSAHNTVNHSRDEYVRGVHHTNTIENYFSVFKRGMKGTYQHCGQQHLHRYLSEFDFRYNHRIANGVDDTMRANAILKGAEGKRLTYRRTNSVLA